MNVAKNWWLGAAMVAGLAFSFYLGYGVGTGGAYTLDVYSGDVHWGFPLNDYSALQKIQCDQGVDKVVLALTLKNRFGSPEVIRAQNFCGLAYFRSEALRPRILGN